MSKPELGARMQPSPHPSCATPSFMENSCHCFPVFSEPSEEEIKNYAFQLYLQSDCEPGHDLDNWLEASACLKANIPLKQSRCRLHCHLYGAVLSERFRAVSTLGI